MIALEYLRNVHLGCALLSLSLFVWRGVRQWRGRPVRSILGRRILPDAVDTVLLLSGVAMAWMLHRVPLADVWMTVKLALVVLYIALGFMAFRLGASPSVRQKSWWAALGVVVGILAWVGVARIGWL